MIAFECMRRNRRPATLEAAVRRFAVDRSGATSIEYAIMASAIAIAVIAAAVIMSDTIESVYSQLNAIFTG